MKRIMIVLLALLLLIPVTGCGGRLASKMQQARSEKLMQFVSFDEPTDARILFRDNFEDGDLDGWQTTGPWGVQQDGEGKALVVTGSAEAAWVPEGVRWSDYYIRAGVKLKSGGVALAFRASRDGSYWLLYRNPGLYLIKESPKGNFTSVTQTDAPRLNAWHILAIGGYGDHLQVHVDTELQMDYVDSSPLTQGTIGVASIDNADALVDNVMAVKLLEDLLSPAEGSELPATVVPPSASALEEAWEPLEEWIPLDEEPLPLVEPTSTPAGESSWIEEEGPPPLVEPTSTPAGDPVWSGEEWSEEELDWSEEEWSEDELDWSEEEWSEEELDWSEEEWPEGELDWSGEDPSPGALPVIDYFYAEAIEDRPGCYYMHWDLHDADAASLNGQGITAPGDGETCESGTYTLRAENAQGSVEETITITAEGQIDEPTTQPDLEIREVVTTPNPNNPNRVRVELRVANNGNAPTGAFTIRWFPHRSEDIVGCSVDASGLAAHDSGRARCSYTYPNHGEMHWMAVVDQDNEIAESDDNNNTYTGSVVIERSGQQDEPEGEGQGVEQGDLPDLALMNMHTVPSELAPGQTGARARFIVQNKGDGASGATNAMWYMGNVTYWSGNCEVPALDPGGYYQCEVELGPVPVTADGVYDQIAIVDPEGEIAESDEAHNQLTHPDSITIVSEASDEPDLVIENAHFEPDLVVKGESFEAVMRVRNDSQVPVTEPFSTLWHFHATLGLEDCVWQFEQGIGPGASKRLSCERTTNAGPGQAPTASTVDTDNVIDESDEVNNDVSVPMSIVIGAQDDPDPSEGDPKPDLLTENAHYEPDPVIQGQPFKAVVRVRNDSQVPVTEPFQVSWNFSSDLGVEDCWWEFEQGLAAGASKQLVCEGMTNAEAGNHFGAVNMHDMGAEIAESDYGNNGVSVPMSIVIVAQDDPDPSAGGKPDLAISDLQVSPNPVKPTGSLSIKYTVVNQSQVPAEPSQAEWRSKDAGFSFLCEVPRLAGGASHTCEHVISILPGVGSYHSQAIADVGRSVDEHDENNNAIKQPFKIQQ